MQQREESAAETPLPIVRAASVMSASTSAGSMGIKSDIVVGKENAMSLHSAPHGACHSRAAGKRTVKQLP